MMSQKRRLQINSCFQIFMLRLYMPVIPRAGLATPTLYKCAVLLSQVIFAVYESVCLPGIVILALEKLCTSYLYLTIRAAAGHMTSFFELVGSKM